MLSSPSVSSLPVCSYWLQQIEIFIRHSSLSPSLSCSSISLSSLVSPGGKRKSDIVVIDLTASSDEEDNGGTTQVDDEEEDEEEEEEERQERRRNTSSQRDVHSLTTE